MGFVDEDDDLAEEIVGLVAVSLVGKPMDFPTLDFVIDVVGTRLCGWTEEIIDVKGQVSRLHGNRVGQERKQHLAEWKQN